MQNRIISLLPSGSEIVALVNQSHLLVGRSHECDYPKSIAHLPIVTAQRTKFTTSAQVDLQVSSALSQSRIASSSIIDPNASLYDLDSALIKSLRPSLIITQDICSVCSVNLSQVRKVITSIFPEPAILSLNPLDLGDVLQNVLDLGKELRIDTYSYYKSLEDRIQSALTRRTRTDFKPKICFLEWLEPAYIGCHWTPQLITMAGGTHPLNESVIFPIDVDEAGIPWRHIRGASKSTPRSFDTINSTTFDIIIICPCGLGLPEIESELTRMWFETGGPWWKDIVENTPTYLVDGNMHFNRPGPRLVDALEFLVSVIHNSKIPDSFPAKLLDVKNFVKPSEIKDGQYLQPSELNQAACERGEDTYIDPATGYRVLTSRFLGVRGSCCGNACRHCPYGHQNVKDTTKRVNAITKTVIFNAKKVVEIDKDIFVLFWSGGKDSFLTLLETRKAYPKKRIVLLTTFEEEDQTVPIQNIHISHIMETAKKFGVGICVVPLVKGADYVATVQLAIDHISESCGGHVSTLVFGDLHLKEIRDWRVATWGGKFEIQTPLFGRDYETLLKLLWDGVEDEGVEIVICAVATDTVGISKDLTYDATFVDSLKTRTVIDMMGENGEFHTRVKHLPLDW